ncbi:MAG: hypothetical protein HY300_09725 [Verrucomicrobia bacterium]|nr:hypothetical protein [Verrucomicrobiota bacterium]
MEGSEDVQPMQSPAATDQQTEAASPAPTPKGITTPDFSGTPQPIGQWTERGDFPQCALGAHVSIHGFTGVVVEIVNQSLKVRSPDGVTQRFNAYRLKTLFAPPDRTKPAPQTLSMERPKPVAPPRPVEDEPEPPAPVRRLITNPDFEQPVRAIRTFATQAGFPECAFGKHVDIPGYSGVVVEIVKGSLKVQSPTGTIRSYNAEALRKLYGRP